MRSNAITRIVIYSLIIVLLSGVLIAGIVLRHYRFNPVSSADGSVTSSLDIPRSDIRSLDIDWASGSVTVMPANVSAITVSESATDNNTYEMTVTSVGDTLEIRFAPEKKLIGIHGSIPSKDLTVLVPMDWECRELNIDSAACHVDVSELKCDSIRVNTASGECVFTECSAGRFQMDSASGDLHYIGTLDQLDFNGASAKAVLDLRNCPSSIQMDSLSGDLELMLPEDCGFTTDCDSLGGKFQCDFETVNSGSHHVYGDGRCVISMDGLSANLIIHHSSHSGRPLDLPTAHHEETEHNSGEHHG